MNTNVNQPQGFMQRDELQTLLDLLRQQGYETIGPTIQQDAIVYRSIQSTKELPLGWTDEQPPAVYELHRDDHQSVFRFNSSPDSWKRFLFPASLEIGTAKLTDNGWEFDTPNEPTPRYALFGVRACDLAAIAVQDRVFQENAYVDPAYQRRRKAAFIVAVNCVTAASTCFCRAMNTGPECDSGFDLLLTEITDGFIVRSGSASGQAILAELNLEPPTSLQISEAESEVANASDQQTKRFDKEGVHDLLAKNLENAHWTDVAERCLSCGNCTMVCPTCFCSTVGDESNLANTEAKRVRRWDSCFNIDFSHTAGGVVRNDIRSRYRQWLVHKLATWEDQFSVTGCVGCGRCITWCPVGIDLTEEVAAIRKTNAT